MATKLKAESKCDEKISQKKNHQILVILKKKTGIFQNFTHKRKY
jgi:hypothetical protein